MAANIVESYTLNFTDLTGTKTGCTTLGSNKFWKGWVEDTGGGMGNFECRWGPTGEAGSDKGSVRGTSLSSALATLNKKVGEKKKKGYTLLDTRSDAEEMAKAAAKGVVHVANPVVLAAPVSRAFDPSVGKLLATIYGSTANTVRAGLSAQAGATESNPIGNLSDRQLDLGGEILDEIGALLKSRLGDENQVGADITLPLLGNTPDRVIVDLTNRFMSNVPREIARTDRGAANLHRIVVSSWGRLHKQREFLGLLRDAHLTQAVFQAAGAQTTATGKEQVWYDGLGCEIDICEVGSADYRKVVEIFNTSQSKKNSNWWRGNQPTVRVARVFKFTRNGSAARYDQYAATVLNKPGAVGRINAWHGTRTENLLGIGKNGLLMPENLPRGVVVSGKAFGRGVYHAPAWNATGHKAVGGLPTDGTNGAFKSLNYTGMSGAVYGGGNSRNAFMFLQDVALGNADVRTSACWDKHRPDNWPTNDFIFACGTKSSGGFVHDELVTFSQDAQVFRYLVEIEAC